MYAVHVGITLLALIAFSKCFRVYDVNEEGRVYDVNEEARVYDVIEEVMEKREHSCKYSGELCFKNNYSYKCVGGRCYRQCYSNTKSYCKTKTQMYPEACKESIDCSRMKTGVAGKNAYNLLSVPALMYCVVTKGWINIKPVCTSDGEMPN